MSREDIVEVLGDLENRNIHLWTEDGKLKFKAASGVLKEEDKVFLRTNKEEIIKYLSFDNVKIVQNQESLYDPFILTAIQQAYVLGRNVAFEYGGTACHIYIELEYEALNSLQVEEVWNVLIERHPMLRATMSINGYQMILKEWDRFKVRNVDLKNNSEEEVLRARDVIKKELDHKVYELEKWPMYSVVVSEADHNAVLHLSIEFLVADWTSIWTILSEYEALYFGTKQQLQPLTLSFRDYLIAEEKIRQGSHFYRDKEYWMKRLNKFPKAPILPVNIETSNDAVTFSRQSFNLERNKWERFQQSARRFGITPTAAVIAAYSMCLSKWSQNKDFCLNLSILNRLDLHPQVKDIVGDFTSSNLLEVNHQKGSSFVEMALGINRRLFEDLDHRLFTGVHVLRELQRISEDKKVLMPYVFTGAIGLISNDKSKLVGTMNTRGISQTPQVFIDCQAMDTYEGLNINLDSRDGVFKGTLVEELFASFKQLMQTLSEEEGIWDADNFNIDLPKWQKEERMRVNATKCNQDTYLLHQRVIKNILENSEKLAVADSEVSWSGKELYREVQKVVAELEAKGIRKGQIVGIALPKSRWQLVASLAVLSLGATYIPLDIKQAIKRSNAILEKTKATCLITLEANKTLFTQDFITITIDNIDMYKDIDLLDYCNKCILDDLAYIIYTSGSTGEPKGVAMTHKAAINTIEAINGIYSINSGDRILNLSQFNFDLSVYDFFGVLSAGGAVIIPDDEQYKNPTHWVEMMNRYQVNIWNTVPALMQLLLIYLSFNKEVEVHPLRVAMLSGDWIPKDQPSQLRNTFEGIKVVSLGGATEGGIWSIYHDCTEGEDTNEWSSIPYGKPLPNQGYQVLDSHLNECPVWVPGELYITGDSLADSYYQETELTEESFIIIDGIRHYKTGDMGMYHPGGEIEFLGRIDNQVKIRGHRIELGEVEAAYKRCINVKDICCVVVELEGEKKIVAVVVPEHEGQEFDSKEIKGALKEWIPQYMIPSNTLVIEDIPLSTNGKVDRRKVTLHATEFLTSVHQKSTITRELSNIEKQICDIFSEVLNVQSIGLDDNVYDMGANSLILARIAGKLGSITEDKIPFDEYLIQLLNEPRISALVEFIEEKTCREALVEDMLEVELQEDGLEVRIQENTSGICIIFNKNLLESVRETYQKNKQHSFVVIESRYTEADILKVLTENNIDEVVIVGMDSVINECLELATILMIQGILPNAVNVIESEIESEIEVEKAYMGDLFFGLTISNVHEQDEIIEALEEVCVGEIQLIECRSEEEISNFVFNGL